jgi:hypothetical protein
VWEAIRPSSPSQFAGKSSDEVAAAWPEWVRLRDSEIRSRVSQGDEDSLVNLWLFGTSFTARPPARPRDVSLHGDGATLAQIAEGRLNDLFDALSMPGANDRLRWARQFFTDRGLNPATTRGRTGIRELLTVVGKRMTSENVEYSRALEATNPAVDPLEWMLPYASLYSGRGLSSDTSILSSFAVDATLEGLSKSGLIGPGSVRRVALVGPGLDFINKADGHDFYPEQTIQPFALADSLIRAGLARAGDLSVTTFDVSARVNQHLIAARERARKGVGYVVQFPLSDAERWSQELDRYWQKAGDRIGEAVAASVPPRTAGVVKVRAVRVRPDVVMSIEPRDLNIVLERLEPLRDDERFDLVVATNVFVYYDAFEQTLAMTNTARMLRPGGSLLSNQAIRPIAPMKNAVGHEAVPYSDRQFDHLFWYQRQPLDSALGK